MPDSEAIVNALVVRIFDDKGNRCNRANVINSTSLCPRTEYVAYKLRRTSRETRFLSIAIILSRDFLILPIV